MSSLTQRDRVLCGYAFMEQDFSSLSLESVISSIGSTLSPFCLFSSSVMNWPKPIWQHRVLRFFLFILVIYQQSEGGKRGLHISKHIITRQVIKARQTNSVPTQTLLTSRHKSMQLNDDVRSLPFHTLQLLPI